jgi:hypothetical protein
MTATFARIAPLSGVVFGALTIAGDTIIGPFPEGDTSADQLPGYYATHAGHVAAGAALWYWATLLFAVFGMALAARFRRWNVPAPVVWTVLAGTVVETVFSAIGAAQGTLLAEIGVEPHVSPAALQAWQMSLSMWGSSAGIVLLLAGVAVAGFGYRALPRWLAGLGLLLAAVQLAPVEQIAFLASIVFLLWAAVVGLVLAVRPGVAVEGPAAAAASVGEGGRGGAATLRP